MNPGMGQPPRKAGESGSVLVVALVLAALGTIGVSAWFSIIDARGHQVEAGLKAAERRVAIRNGRALAHRAVYAQLLHGNTGLGADLVCRLPDGKGGATIRSFGTVPLRSDVAGPPARNGATPLSSQTVDVAVDLEDGVSSERWTFRLRSQHPVLGGDLLSLHAPVRPADPAPLVSGSLMVKGRAVLWDAVVRDLNSGLRADEYLLPNGIAGTTTFATTANAATLPLNYPHFQRTTGVGSGGPSYRGELELVSASVNPQNSYEARLQGTGPVFLDGAAADSEGRGPDTVPRATGDDALIAYIGANPPPEVVATLSQQDALTSPVLLAALNKSNPRLSNQDLLTIFTAQAVLPDDALTALMARLDPAGMTPALDQAMIDLNVANETRHTSDGRRQVQLFLERSDLNQVVVTGVTQLRLFGQSDSVRQAAAAALPPLLVLVDNRGGQSLARIDLFHENRRALILVVASAPGTPAMPATAFRGSSAFPVWRMVADLQDTGLAFDLSAVAGARILGGIRGNHRLGVAGGTLTLDRDPNAAVLATRLSRDAWTETSRNLP